MKDFFKSLKTEREKLGNFYTDKELRNAGLLACIPTFLIGLLIALITVSVFQVFVYMPYFAYTISGIALIWIMVMYYLFEMSALKSIKNPEGEVNLFKAFFVELMIIILSLVVFVALLEIITIPIFFL